MFWTMYGKIFHCRCHQHLDVKVLTPTSVEGLLAQITALENNWKQSNQRVREYDSQEMLEAKIHALRDEMGYHIERERD